MNKLNRIIKNNYKWIILLFMSIIFIWLALRVKGSPELKIDNTIYTFIHQFESLQPPGKTPEKTLYFILIMC